MSKKKTHRADFEPWVFSAYLENHLSYTNLFSSICILFWRAFSWKQKFFKSGHKISWYFQKHLFSGKELPIGKRPFWKIEKLFFMNLKFRKKKFPAESSLEKDTNRWKYNFYGSNGSRDIREKHMVLNQLDLFFWFSLYVSKSFLIPVSMMRFEPT